MLLYYSTYYYIIVRYMIYSHYEGLDAGGHARRVPAIIFAINDIHNNNHYWYIIKYISYISHYHYYY